MGSGNCDFARALNIKRAGRVDKGTRISGEVDGKRPRDVDNRSPAAIGRFYREVVGANIIRAAAKEMERLSVPCPAVAAELRRICLKHIFWFCRACR